MIIEMKVPSPGESVTEVQIAQWLKKDGDYVYKEEDLCEIDSDKATLTMNAEQDGRIQILVPSGETIAVGTIVCTIDTSYAKPENVKTEVVSKEIEMDKQKEESSYASGTPSVSAKKLMDENDVQLADVISSGKSGRITKADVLDAISKKDSKAEVKEEIKFTAFSRNERREKTSMLRKKLSQRLVAVKNQTAMLTTFNEVDMSAIMDIRKKYKDSFKEKYGVNLGFMSFFTKAVCESLKEFPLVNAYFETDEIIYHDYADIGIAVSAPKGLMVPVIRNAESLSISEIEKTIADLANKARNNKLSMDDMSGGTFTITNGGVFGSMLSTPIINPPQSAILGMHNIVERAVAINGKVEVRPIMYIALSYDHRIIDGKDSVGFLKNVKEILENPMKLMYAGKDPIQEMIGL